MSSFIPILKKVAVAAPTSDNLVAFSHFDQKSLKGCDHPSMDSSHCLKTKDPTWSESAARCLQLPLGTRCRAAAGSKGPWWCSSSSTSHWPQCQTLSPACSYAHHRAALTLTLHIRDHTSYPLPQWCWVPPWRLPECD